MTYRFGPALAIALAACRCTSSPETRTPAPVMDVNSSPRENRVARTELKYERVRVGDREFLIQEAHWADGSRRRALAAIRIATEVPLDIVVLDDAIPAPRPPALGPFVLDEVPGSLASLRIRQTRSFLKGPSPREELPACEEREIRALARLGGYAEERPTLPRAELPTGSFPVENLVCLRFSE